MKFLGFYVLAAAAAVSVVFAQQSDINVKLAAQETITVINASSKVNEDANIFPEATLTLKVGLINGTNCMTESANKMAEGISKAKQIILRDPKAAKLIMKQAFQDAQALIFKYGLPTVRSLGEALALSNSRARQGIDVAMLLIDEGGVIAYNLLNTAESLCNRGIDAGGNANEILLNAVGLTSNTGILAAFGKVQKAIRKADQALRDAYSKPIAPEPVVNQNCQAAVQDPKILDAIKDINTAAAGAVERDTNADLVPKLIEAYICSLVDYAKIADDAIKNVANIKMLAGSDPSAKEVIFLKSVGAIKKEMDKLASKIYLVFGDVGLKSGNRLINEIEAATMVIEKGQADINVGIEAAIELMHSAILGNDNDTIMLTFEACSAIGSYDKVSFIQSIVESAKLLFSAI